MKIIKKKQSILLTCEMSFKIKNVKKKEKMLLKYLQQTKNRNISQNNVRKWEKMIKIDFPL